MRIHSSRISALALGSVLSATLIVGGCGNKNKNKTANVDIKMAEIAPRNVGEAEALQSLTSLCLNETGQGVVSWASRTGSAGNYVFNDVKFDGNGDDDFAIGALTLQGAHMQDGETAFDKIALTDISGGDGTQTVQIANVELLRPSVDLAKGLARALCGADDAFDKVSGDFGFGGAVLSGLSFKDGDNSVELGKLSFGEAKDKTGVFNMSNLSFNVNDEGPVSINVAEISVSGVNLEKYKGLFTAMALADEDGTENEEEVLKTLMQSINPYNPDFKHMRLSGFKMDANGLKVDMDAFTADVKKKGGETVMTQEMSPLTITPPRESEDADMVQIIEAIDALGYEQLVFTMVQKTVLNEASDSMKITDSYIALKDGFKLSYDYDMRGYKAFMDKAMAGQNGSGSVDPLAMLGIMDNLTIGSARLALKDNSIIERSFKLAAKQQGGTPGALKTQAKMGLGFLTMMAQDEEQQRLAADLGTALTKLIDDGGTFIIEANPAEPYSLADASSTTDQGGFDVSKLNLSIRTE